MISALTRRWTGPQMPAGLATGKHSMINDCCCAFSSRSGAMRGPVTDRDGMSRPSARRFGPGIGLRLDREFR